MRICFLNPFGTDAYDRLIREVLEPGMSEGTELEIRHLESGPRNLDYYAPKQLVQVEILRAAKQAQDDGFDALIIGCVYDPALTEARELLDIPVVGPLEASLAFARAFGHRFAIVTDHHKAVPEIEDRVRLYGAEANCRGVEAVGWFVDDMVKDPDAVAHDTYAHVRDIMQRTRAETVIVGCTIVSACYERACLNGVEGLDGLSIINPNMMAVKMAESLVALRRVGQYRISRAAYYQRLDDHDPAQAAEVAPYFAKEGIRQ
jgi:allantoin racemase